MVNHALSEIGLYQPVETIMFTHLDYFAIQEHHFYHRILGYNPTNYNQFFQNFCIPFSSTYKSDSYIHLKDIQNFFNHENFFINKKIKFHQKIVQLWSHGLLADNTDLQKTFKIISLYDSMAHRQAYCSLFFSKPSNSEYLEDELVNAMLDIGLLYIQKLKSYIVFSEQLDFFFMKEYTQNLWKNLSFFQKIKYFRWKYKFGFETFKIKRLIFTRHHIKNDFKFYLTFECENGLRADPKFDQYNKLFVKFLDSWVKFRDYDPKNYKKLIKIKDKLTQT